jgi:hypothetical protein
MSNWNLKAKVAAVITLFAAYFPIALYLKYTYDPFPWPPLPGVAVIAELKGPFIRFPESGYGFSVPGLDDFADSVGDEHRSPFVVYEDDRPLGPAHTGHADIAKLGHGRFSHWKGIGFITRPATAPTRISTDASTASYGRHNHRTDPTDRRSAFDSREFAIAPRAWLVFRALQPRVEQLK